MQVGPGCYAALGFMLSKDRAAAPFPAGLSPDCHGDSEWAQKDDATALPSHPGLCAELPHGLMCSSPSLSEPPPALTPVDTAPPGYRGECLSHGGRGYVFSWVDYVASLQAFIIYVHTHTYTQALRPLFLHTSTLSTLGFYFPLPYKLCAVIERTVLFFPGAANG